MAQPEVSRTTLEWALSYWQLGWNALAAPAGEKAPVGSWKRWQTNRMVERDIRRQFENRTGLSIWVATGIVSGLAVLDCDSEEAEARWADKIDLNTARVKTSKGRHFFFRLEEETPSWKEDGVDFQAEGKGVIVPPSQHKSGFRYTWEELPTATSLLPLPELLRRTGARGPVRARSVSVGTGEATEKPRDMLAHVLAGPAPAEGERNTWLISQLGKAALRAKGDRLLYDALATQLADKSGLEEAEAWKTVESAWSMETSKTIDGVLPTIHSGFLCDGPVGETTLSLTETKGGIGVGHWANAGFKALGVAVLEDRRVFDVEVKTAKGARETQLDTVVLADARRLTSWLLANEVHQISPPGAPKGDRGTFLTAYLDSQNPPAFEMVDHLGWHQQSGAYITNDGVITDKGKTGYRGVKPSPQTRELTRDRVYGMGGREAARELLREVATYHEEAAVAMIGAWWAAVFLKTQLMDRHKIFPLLEVAASSESGKTTGFIPLLMRLGGDTGNPIAEISGPALRNAAAPHQGIVRVDDKGDLKPITELLRTAPMGGTSVKMGGANWSERHEFTANAAIMITGQGHGIGQEKAMVERTVGVALGNPTRRKSRHNPDEMQLVDVIRTEKALKEGDYAGEFVQMALDWWQAHEDDVKIGAGRLANKHAIMRVGAALFAAMTGEKRWADLVERQLEDETGGDTLEDALTLEILPHTLSILGHQEKPKQGRFEHDPPTPVLVDTEGTVWFCPAVLETWLRRDMGQRWDQRIHSSAGIQQQARSLGLGGAAGVDRKQMRVLDRDGQATNAKLSFWSCKAYSPAILERLAGTGDAQERLV